MGKSSVGRCRAGRRRCATLDQRAALRNLRVKTACFRSGLTGSLARQLCFSDTSQPMNESINSYSIPGYELIEAIAVGGMATVFKARQQSLGRIVAIKIVRPTGHKDREMTERVRHEARIAATVNHQNIVTVYDAGEYQGIAYSVMELVKGESVGERISRPRRRGR